jgi:hypothetical protein
LHLVIRPILSNGHVIAVTKGNELRGPIGASAPDMDASGFSSWILDMETKSWRGGADADVAAFWL